MPGPSDITSIPRRTAWEVQRSVTFALFLRELKARFGGRWLGSFWVLLQPVAHLVFMLLVFVYIRNRVLAGVDFAVFLVVGIVPFFLFRNLSLRSMDSIDNSRGLFGYRQVKPIDPMISRALLETCLYGVIYLVMLGGLGWLGYDTVPAHPLELFGMLSLTGVMGFGLGVLFATVTDDMPQTRTFIRIAYFPLYLVSGVVWPVHLMPDVVLDYFVWNPVLQAIELMRSYFFTQYVALPEVSAFYVFFWALGILTASLCLYRVRRHSLLAR